MILLRTIAGWAICVVLSVVYAAVGATWYAAFVAQTPKAFDIGTIAFSCATFSVIAAKTSGWSRTLLLTVLSLLILALDVWPFWFSLGAPLLLATVLVSLEARGQGGRTRTARLITLTLVFGLFYVWEGLVGSVGTSANVLGVPGFLSPFTVAFVLLVVFVFASFVAANSVLGRIDTRGYFRAGVLIALSALTVPLLTDDPPLDKDYSPGDVVSTWPGAVESREVLMSLRHDVRSSLSTNVWTTTNIFDYADEINKAWEATAESRRIIERLDSFGRIADITDPGPIDVAAGRTNTALLPFSAACAYRTTSQVQGFWIWLKTEQNAPDDTTAELVRFHSVMRKCLPGMTIVTDKTCVVALMRNDISQAFRIASHTNCTGRALQALRDGFPVIAPEDLSMRQGLIWDYLCLEAYLKYAHDNHRWDVWLADFTWHDDREPFRMLAVVLNFCALPGFKPNMTTRCHRQLLDTQLAEDRLVPPKFDSITHEEKRLAPPSIRNVAGQLILRQSNPSFVVARKQAFDAVVLSGLLALYLDRRLGRENASLDPFTSEPYPLDERGVPFSPGWDRKPGTLDDIRLQAFP